MVVEGEYYDGPCKLLELPHYVMRILFSYLDATSLYHLSGTCNYLKEFILDPTFWKRIDAREDPNTCDKIEYCTSRIHSRTTHLFLRGNLSYIDLPSNFFSFINPFDNIKVLALENVKLKGVKVTLRDFPAGLEELSLKRTYVKDSDYFFQHSVKNMPKLRVLILDECSWVTCSFLLSICKYEYLEIISIVKCLRVHLNTIPYLNVAKLGCKKLKIFDCRFTGIGGELLRTFYSKENIQRLYFQSFKSSEVDYQEKIVNQWDSTKKRQSVDPSYTDMSISDRHLIEFISTTAKPKNEVEKISYSVLYKDPYPECTCGSKGAKEDELYKYTPFSEEDIVHIPSGRDELKFVCNKHMKDLLNLPSHFKDFFLSHQMKFNPASLVSDTHMDSDSNSDEEDGDDGCCYFGMGTNLIVPSMYDRTPSVREEMSLPEEGASARNQSSPNVYILDANANRNNNQADENRHGRAHTERRVSQDLHPTKRRYELGESDESDTDEVEAKKSKTSDLNGVTSEAQETLVNQLLESADDVSERIERIIRSNNISREVQERILRSEPSTSRSRNGTSSNPSQSNSRNVKANSSHGANEKIDEPSCSRNDTSRASNGRNNASSNKEEYAEWIHAVNNNINSRQNLRAYERGNERVEFQILQFQDIPDSVKKCKIPLKRLSLRGYKKVTDFTLNYIKNLDIELIDLTYTSVTKRGIENFLVHNPNCRVIHPFYCICKPKNPLF
ncbi:unnamed protein product [Phyllotreta striolata]|uniref:F-box domain-containing protein n=1 Tax=Phyllotreta striolata TaxID=444603 RepID=A0A9N9TSY4_PHYSR|nr:unnamed protein product [Phyllotreta striolata]